MTAGGIPRNLIVAVVAGTVALVVLSATAALGLHAYGTARLDRARAAFSARWGHLDPPAAAQVSDPENGALWLENGGRAIEVSLADHLFYTRLMAEAGTSWTADDRRQARRILDEQRDALASLLRAASSPGFRLEYDSPASPGSESDHLAVIKGLRLLVLEARLAWQEGRRADSLAAFDALGRTVDGLLRTPTMLTLSLGAAADRWTAAAAADVVADPCADAEALRALRDRLPLEDPRARASLTIATSVSEIADEGLLYIEGIYDPSMGWSIPFWVSNRFLLEDLVVAATLEGWSRYLELGQVPAARWPIDAQRVVWAGTDWPPWVALAGYVTPNLLPNWVRVQAASTQLQLLRAALEIRLDTPGGPGPDSCTRIDTSTPLALTGAPVSCRWDPGLAAVVLEVPGAEEVLGRHFDPGSIPTELPPIVLPATEGADCH